MANDRNLLLPICKISESAGVATFTIKNESASASLLTLMQTIVVVGNFQKLGCQQGELAIDINKDSLTNLVRSACPLLNEITGLALRDSRPLYTAPNEDFATNAQPVTYKVGQIECETLPDSFQGALGWVGYDIYLSSLAFTPSKQIGANNPTIPTFSYELFNFDKYPSDINSISAIESDLSSYDVLLKHKQHHPLWQNSSVLENQCSAKLEYIPLSALLGGEANVKVDSEENSISSIQHYEPDGSLQIYDFDGNSTKEFSDISASANYDIMLRHNINGNQGVPREVSYTSLSGMIGKIAPRGDVDAGVGYFSIQKYLDGNNNPYFGFYNFQQSGKDRTLNITLSYDGTARYIHTSGHSGDSPDPNLEFITRNNNGQPHVSYDAITITAPKVPASQVSGLTEEISSVVQTVDLSTNVISVLQNNPQVEPILSAKLSSDFWIVGGTYNKNCYGQSIGDGNKILTISLNGRSLYGMGTGLALDWDDRICYDENGHRAINWSDTGVDAKCLIHRQGTPSVDWQNMNLMGRLNGTTVAWEDRQLKGAWSVVAGTNPGGTASLNVGGNLTISNNGTLTIGSTTLTEAQLQQLLRLI